MGTSFDLFGTLVGVDRPTSPAAAVADALRERGVSVPDDFRDAYREPHVDAPPGAEVPLPVHVAAVLRDCGVAPPARVVRRAVAAAVEPTVRTRPGASDAVAAAAAWGPVACCSNCAVPGLATRALARSDVAPDAFDALVTSVGCGWRKPDRRIFATVARRLDVRPDALVHVGDDPRTDGGIAALGGRFVDVGETPLSTLADRLDAPATGESVAGLDGTAGPGGDGGP